MTRTNLPKCFQAFILFACCTFMFGWNTPCATGAPYWAGIWDVRYFDSTGTVEGRGYTAISSPSGSMFGKILVTGGYLTGTGFLTPYGEFFEMDGGYYSNATLLGTFTGTGEQSLINPTRGLASGVWQNTNGVSGTWIAARNGNVRYALTVGLDTPTGTLASLVLVDDEGDAFGGFFDDNGDFFDLSGLVAAGILDLSGSNPDASKTLTMRLVIDQVQIPGAVAGSWAMSDGTSGDVVVVPEGSSLSFALSVLPPLILGRRRRRKTGRLSG